MGTPPFLWLGNHPAMDLLNTEPIVAGERLDLLPDVAALLSWIELAGIAPASGSRDISRREATRTLHFVGELRRALRRALAPDSTGGDSTDDLNELLSSAPGTLRVDAETDGVSLAASTPGAQLRLDIAASVVDIFRHDRRRVRQCAGAACVLMFLDVSKSGRRRWCDMAACGNRAKAAAHHARSKACLHS